MLERANALARVPTLERPAVLIVRVGGGPSIPVSSGRQAVSQYPPPNFRGLVLVGIEADFCKYLLESSRRDLRRKTHSHDSLFCLFSESLHCKLFPAMTAPCHKKFSAGGIFTALPLFERLAARFSA